MSTEDLLRQYQGHIVPQKFNGGFVALSYVVSFIGAASTLELINRRTGSRGIFNHALLLGSAITMGGIAIWCMHFIGNRAIDLADGQSELQVSYSSGFTAVSFFVPILVLLAAFVAIGTNNVVSWWRVTVGGILCGAAVCGMHYLGNASIANYVCVYRTAYVVGAAIIAVVASTVALAVFFVFRAMWASSWWKRAISAVVLAGAVSGMHWCAAVGTSYRLVEIKAPGKEPSRSATVIVVICLSIGACFIIAGSAILRARNMKKTASRAQQITLGAAIFDKNGKILVNTDGFIPSTVVTDSFIEKNSKEAFGVAHPLFHWMFHASRNWSGISSLISGMRHHLTQLPHFGSNKEGRRGIQLINEHGEMIEGYDIIFRELFCLAAAALGDRLREHITSTGILWDQILSTGTSLKRRNTEIQRDPRASPSIETGDQKDDDNARIDVAEKGFHFEHEEFGRGSLMFLVRKVSTDREAERLVSAGYRFADLHQVSDIIKTSMQIQAGDFESKLRDMATYADQQTRLEPGVHLGFFAIRARVNRGFEVLVRKCARSLLPSTPLSIKNIERWHVEFLRHLDGLTVPQVLHNLGAEGPSTTSSSEREFANQLRESILALRSLVQEPLFEEAVLSSTVVRLQGREEGRQTETDMMALRLVIPIHRMPSSPTCELMPLNFFKMRQVADEHQQDFMSGVHREFGPVIKTSRRGEAAEETKSGISTRIWPFHRNDSSMSAKLPGKLVTSRAGRQSFVDSARSSSTINLCPPERVHRMGSVDTMDEGQDDTQQQIPSYGGIMVFQEITVNVEDGQSPATPFRADSSDTVVADSSSELQKSSSAGIELRPMGNVAPVVGTNVHVGAQTLNSTEIRHGDMNNIPSFVDVLFAECVEAR